MNDELTIKQLSKYMLENDLSRVVVDVVDVNLPKIGYQEASVIPKRIIVIGIEIYNQSNYLYFMARPLFKSLSRQVPGDFKFVLTNQEVSAELLNEYDVHKQAIEKDFRDAFEAHHAKIDSLVKDAEVALAKAVALSKETGIPFRPDNLCGFSMSYIPKSFSEKFSNSDEIRELAQDLTGAYGSSSGWQTSQTC